jgi:hypothetical protein
MGRLTKDPELRRTGSGTAVASFTIACDRDFSNKESGEKETDIKPLIHTLEKIDAESGNYGIRAVLDAGNLSTLKPETLIDAINKYQPYGNITFFAAHRKALLTKENKELYSKTFVRGCLMM